MFLNQRSRKKEDLQQMAQTVPFWWHSIELGEEVITNGVKTAKRLAFELRSLNLPDLTGKTVLDIGAWDGFFSFAAEAGGGKQSPCS